MKGSLDLNKNQTIAANHKDGAMMVIAGPGSGKTTVITYRIKNLIEKHNVPAKDILVITFARAAADEMRKRFTELMDVSADNLKVTFATFHSFFYSVIRGSSGYNLDNVLNEGERKEIIKSAIRSLGDELDDGEDFVQDVLNEISLVKNELINLEYHNPIVLPAEAFKTIMKLYENWKQENNKIDFDDMLSKCYALIRENKHELVKWQRRYKYIMIDEFQDINRVQYEAIKMFAKPLDNIFIVGDDDQSIYRFRGSRPEFLLNFNKDFAEVKSVLLDVNYRSSDKIINICNAVISNNKRRFGKDMSGTGFAGDLPVIASNDETRHEALYIADKIKEISKNIDLSEIAVVYRTNIQSRPIIDAFMDLRIPFQIKDDTPGIYEHWISRDIYAYFKLALDRSDNDSFELIANKPKRYLNKSIISMAKKKGGSILSNLYDSKTTQTWQVSRLEELTFYLNALKSRSAYDAVKYLRKAIGYDEYIKEYADYRKMNSKGLFEILNELQETSKDYKDIVSYINHIDEVINKLTEYKKKKKNKDGTEKNAVTLSTIHGVKGLEYKAVFVSGVIEGIIPHEKSNTEAELEEECRLLYVAMTRAKRQLFICVLKSRNEADSIRSRYLNNINNNLYKECQK